MPLKLVRTAFYLAGAGDAESILLVEVQVLALRVIPCLNSVRLVRTPVSFFSFSPVLAFMQGIVHHVRTDIVRNNRVCMCACFSFLSGPTEFLKNPRTVPDET